MKKAVLYLRYSSAGQSEQSIEGQRAVCQRYAESNDITLVGEYIDRATSASHDTHKRVNFLRMIDDAPKGKFDTILVYKLDRFARNRYDSANYRYKLQQAGVKLLSATEPLSDEPASVLMESMLEGMAEYYSLELAQKVNRGIAQSIEKRQWLGGPTPFGFRVVDKQLQPDPVSAPLLKRAFELVLEGYNYRQISEWLASQGARSARGKPFGSTAISRMLHSKRAIGYYCYRDLEEPGVMPAIVDEETFYRVQKRLKMTEKKHHDTTDYLLAGKLFCGHCGRQMNGEKGRSKNGEYYYYYTCRGRKKALGCTKHRVRKEDIENAVVEKALALLDDEMIERVTSMVMTEYHAALAAEDPVKDLKAELATVEKQLENGLNAVLSGFHNKALEDKLNALQQQKEQIENRIEEIEAGRFYLHADMVRFYLYKIRTGAENSEDHRKRLIETFVRKVILWDEEGDDGEGRNRKVQIVFNISGSTTFECSPSVPNGPPFEMDTNTMKVVLDEMVIVAQYTLYFS